ncbi:ATP-binding protein [Myxococcota bacterium]|nr:ATP-binding protein [Myxococcota bacterium]
MSEPADFAHILSQPDSRILENTQNDNFVRPVQRTLAAFANAVGGNLVLGSAAVQAQASAKKRATGVASRHAVEDVDPVGLHTELNQDREG